MGSRGGGSSAVFCGGFCVGKGRCYRVVGACESVSFKVVVLRLDSCKGLSRGGKSGEGGPRGGGVWKIAKFWERFQFGKARSGFRAEALGQCSSMRWDCAWLDEEKPRPEVTPALPRQKQQRPRRA